jgi:hypothetical protein
MPELLPPLTTLRVSLPNSAEPKCESFWARPLGNDRYELRNIAFSAYGLNYLDVVHATRNHPRPAPEIRSVLRPSGHKTFRLLFFKHIGALAQHRYLAQLRAFGVRDKRGGDFFYALDLEPAVNAAHVRDLLDGLVQRGVMIYESTEERAPGSFDALPRNSTTPAGRSVTYRRSIQRGPH